jgi:mono/diheme cytochrome c family protein
LTTVDTARAGRRALLAAAVLALPACTDWAGYDIDVAIGHVPALSTMREDVIPDRYEMLREPPAGTVPVVHPLGDVPAPYTQAQLDSIAPFLTNPLPATPQVLHRGRLQYEQNCAVCHGTTGDGQGPIIGNGRFPFATVLTAAGPTATRSDGYLYAVIDVGRGLMPPYGHRMTHADRWAVVHYLRELQGRPSPAGAEAIPDVSPVAERVEDGPEPQGVDTPATTTEN